MRIWKLSLLAAFLAALATSGQALEAEPFSQHRFEQLQAEDALILIDIWATWCPTCRRQREILARFQSEHPEVELHILEVDFDRDKEVVRQFRAPRQSTLLLFRGEQQVWYGVAETRREVIYDTILQAPSSS